MPQKVKCPSCEAELELPDDPRVDELKGLIQDQARVIQTISERLTALGEKPPAAPSIPAGTTTPQGGSKKKKKRYEGAFIDDDAEEDDGEDNG